MPDKSSPLAVFSPILCLFLFFVFVTSPVFADEGINYFYIRFDIKSSNNKIQDENLIMTPVNHDFRAEKFSLVSISGVISATPGESIEPVEKRIKENALKNILVNHGLKSVKTKDYDTVVSYEGVVITPLTLKKSIYIEANNGYEYEAGVEFSPIAFPDRWESLNFKAKIKGMLDDFFQFFK